MILEYVCILAGAAALARGFMKILAILEGEHGKE